MKKPTKTRLRCAIQAMEPRHLLSTTIYVDANASGATHDGTSWASAFVDLQQGLAAAAATDEIHVADGTYKPTSATDLNATFQLKTGVSLLGGYAGDGAPNPDLRDTQANTTVLSGDLDAAGHSENLVTGSGTNSTALVDGFTITKATYGVYNQNGSPTINNCTLTQMFGRAIYNLTASPKVSNCTFTQNTGYDEGSAIYSRDSSITVIEGCNFDGTGALDLIQFTTGSGATVTDCTFTNAFDCAVLCEQTSAAFSFTRCTFTSNTTHATAVYNFGTAATFSDCTFTGYKGGAMQNLGATIKLLGCTFSNNIRSQDAAAAILNQNSTVELTDCIFTGNVAASGFSGGAVYSTGSQLTLARCKFSGNSAGVSGGAIYSAGSTSVTASSCVFENNAAPNGACSFENSSLSLTECTFTGNQATSTVWVNHAGAIYNKSSTGAISNSTFTNNICSTSGGDTAAGAIYNYASSPTISGCTFSGNQLAGTPARGGAAVIHNESAANALITNCTFTLNFSASQIGVMQNVSSSPTITGCTFQSNNVPFVVLSSGGSPSINNCSFIQNFGRAVNNTSASNQTIKNCIFNGNAGGGILIASGTVTAINCIFSGNVSLAGGAVTASGTSTIVNLINCTLASNSANIGGGISNTTATVNVTNCILWGNTATNNSQIRTTTGTVSVTYSDVQGGYIGVGNIDFDPQFVRNPGTGSDGKWGTSDDDYGNLRLRLYSTGVDAGSNPAVPAGVTTDIISNPRIVDVPGRNDPNAIVDMGAYERIAPHADGEFLLDAPRPSIKVTFNSDVLLSSLSAGDLTLINQSTGLPIDCAASSTVNYDPATHSGTWSFSILLLDGNYRATVPATSIHDTTDNQILTTDLIFDFYAFGGDANHDRVVDIRDLAVLAMNWQGSGKLFSQADFNYDGKVDAADLGILSGNWQKNLPAVSAVLAPVSLGVRAPVRAPIRASVLT